MFWFLISLNPIIPIIDNLHVFVSKTTSLLDSSWWRLILVHKSYSKHVFYMLAACKGYNKMSKMFLYLLNALLLEGCGEVSLCKSSVGIWDMMNCIG